MNYNKFEDSTLQNVERNSQSPVRVVCSETQKDEAKGIFGNQTSSLPRENRALTCDKVNKKSSKKKFVKNKLSEEILKSMYESKKSQDFEETYEDEEDYFEYQIDKVQGEEGVEDWWEKKVELEKSNTTYDGIDDSDWLTELEHRYHSSLIWYTPYNPVSLTIPVVRDPAAPAP
jgi:hypothetical protein